MEEKLIKKLEKLLDKAGLGEEEVGKILEIAKGDVEEEEPKEEGEPTVEPQGEDLPQEEEPKGDESVEEQPVEEEVVEEPQVDAPVEDVPAEVPPTEVPPVVEQPQVPVEELLTKIDELDKANEGLVARLQSLEDALKQAKVLTTEQGAIGLDQNNAPANDPVDNPMEDVLAEINHRR